MGVRLTRVLAVLAVSVVTLAHAGCAKTPSLARVVSLRRGGIRLDYDLATGTADFFCRGARKIARFHSAVTIGGVTYSSTAYTSRHIGTRGNRTVITLTGNGLPTMKQTFTLGSASHLLAQVEMDGRGLKSNWMAPVVADSAGCVDIGKRRDVRALSVPFDNDKWVRYTANSINASGTSYEVAAFFDNASRSGLLVGSVTHDTWKTGVTFSGAAGKLDKLAVFGGVADSNTRDVMPHGSVTGNRIISPTVMIGFYPDWRDGLEDYADANAAVTPRLKWTGGVPFGWNSWGKLKTDLTYAKAIAVSDFFAGHLQNHHFSNHGTAYINLDSYWDRLTDPQLKMFVDHAHALKQKAGIYWTPFVYWGTNPATRVEGGPYTYSDILMRTDAGKVMSLDGGLAVDPTHPGTLRRMDYFVGRFTKAGFDYVKLDFLSHGAMEGGSRNGKHFIPKIQTGIQAYNFGMRYLRDRIGSAMFISESIAPIFPYQYAHARRVACDTFGAIDETAYVMNSETYGWWLSGRLYDFNDPDHMVLEGHSPNENRSRVTSAAIAGTVFLNGDDLSEPAGQHLAETCLTNEAVNKVARLSKAFRPVEGNTGRDASNVFVLKNGNTDYVAVFNYDAKVGVSRTIDLARAGLGGTKSYILTDLWTGTVSQARGKVTVQLGPAQSTLLRFR